MSLTRLDSQITLPPQLKIELTDEDVQKLAINFVKQFSDAIATGNVDSVASLFTDDCLWRDFLALTWDFNTLFRINNVRKMLEARLAKTQITNIRLAEHRDLAPTFVTSSPLLFVNVPFNFQTAAGDCIGIAKLVPLTSLNSVEWKVYILFTNLDQIKGHPDKIGPNRKKEPIPNFIRERQKEMAFRDEDPRVIIIGAGHAALDVAARLKVKDVPTLVIEKNVRLGDNWRNRYQSLTLHDFSWMASSPYLSFPANWPAHPSAAKFADWLEMYAKVMDLNVWTSTTVTHIERDNDRNEWIVHVIKADGSLRAFRPKYVVAGVGFGEPYIPDFAGVDKFNGKMIHAYHYSGPEEHVGKKVVVIGSATAGFAADNDVPVDIKDRLGASFPFLVLKRVHQTNMKKVIKAEKSFYDKLEKAGFQLNHGPDGSGFLYLGLTKQGRFYIDFGTSDLIIDGKVKLKSGSIKEFTSTGMIFEDGTSLDADVVILATGVEGFKNYLDKLLKLELADKIPPFHLSSEGEMEVIKAKEVGLFTDSYKYTEDL
ncbi:hypothetical protein Clacol_005535 [Clathrus columnatus]|uniref:Flavin-containing monooxygenase n=1 Tax=Clathrus columnatus TaxID=1419009 RepID=A0AAV5ADV6_9AGAM|nr:hypothetical protein Clacol_005535 [Clathrus columnatus]